MKLFSLPVLTPPDKLTNAELDERIAHTARRIARMGQNVGQAAAHASIIVAGFACAVAFIGIGLAPMAALGAGLFVGFCTFMGTGYTYNTKLRAALREEEALKAENESRIAFRRADEAAQKAIIDRQQKDAFNAKAQDGLPLEKSITVSKAPLKLKPRQHWMQFGVRP